MTSVTSSTSLVDADYLVVGAGAAGMAFVDSLVDHDPDARVALVDRARRRRRALARGVPVRPAPPVVDRYLRGRLHAAGAVTACRPTAPRPGCTSGRTSRRSWPTTTRCATGSSPPVGVELFTGCDFLGGRTFCVAGVRGSGTRSRTAAGSWTPATCRRTCPPRARRPSPSTAPTSSGACCPGRGRAGQPRSSARARPPPTAVVFSAPGPNGRWSVPSATPICWVRPRDPLDARPRQSSSPTRWSTSAWSPG